jgi:hypothetical protein
MFYIYGEYINVCQTLKINSMKKRNLLWMGAAFVAGSMFGISLLGLFSFSSPNPQAGDSVLTTIPVADAHSYFQAYYRVTTPLNARLKGFAIDKAQATVISSMLTATPSVAGFRLYFGNDPSGNRVAIIVGINANGSDLTNNIYTTRASANVGPCPTVCDANSPITAQ